MNVDGLQVSQFVEEHVIEHESADGKRGPLMTSSCSELLRSLTFYEESRQTQARRQSTQGDFPASTVDITEKPGPRPRSLK
jgi:hypothetical protein